jgi:protein-S-isoprenylcysteine O-methyltransferase Ste14
MRRILAFAYGLVAYVLFFGTFCYAIGFVTGLLVPKSVDSGPAGSTTTALIVDLALLTLFAVQHSGMARPGFKRWWTRIVPAAIERSTYVFLASSVLLLLFAFWRPLPAVVWQATGPAAAVVWALAALGWTTVLLSTFMIGHFELFGLRQVWLELRGRVQPADGFRTPLLYRFVRHPIMLGFLIAFWSAPTMTVGHLLFALVTTGYILVAVQLEERDLIAAHGETYRRYRREVPAFLPLPGKQSGGMPVSTGTPSQAAR